MLHGLNYNSIEDLDYPAKKNKENSEDCHLPLRVTVGVSIALCGLFLLFVPMPLCQSYGPIIIETGMALAIEGTINRIEEFEDKNSDH